MTYEPTASAQERVLVLGVHAAPPASATDA